MKKFICILMIFVLAFSLFACSNGDDSDKKDNDKNVGKIDKADDNTVTQQKKPEHPTIEETVLFEESGLKVTALSVEYDDVYGTVGVNLLIENNMGYDIELHSWNGGVNGYMMDISYFTEVKNGESVNSTFNFSGGEINRCNIDVVTYFEFKFKVAKTTGAFVHTTDTIKLETSAYNTHQVDYSVEGTVIYDKNDVRIVAKEILTDNYCTHIFVENKSNNSIRLQDKETYVNGIEFASFCQSTYVPKDRYGVFLVEYSTSDMEDNNITEINEIKISFEIEDEYMNTFDTTELVTLIP